MTDLSYAATELKNNLKDFVASISDLILNKVQSLLSEKVSTDNFELESVILWLHEIKEEAIFLDELSVDQLSQSTVFSQHHIAIRNRYNELKGMAEGKVSLTESQLYARCDDLLSKLNAVRIAAVDIRIYGKNLFILYFLFYIFLIRIRVTCN